jgi:ferric-dicitrate binding protein FerR (iron transport regulator)
MIMELKGQGGAKPSQDERRKKRQAIFRIAAVIGLTVLALALLAAGPESRQATLVVRTGQATITTARTIVPGISVPGMTVVPSGEARTVRQGDTIQMDAVGSGDLNLPDGTRIEISEGTILSVSQLRIARESTAVTLRLQAGHIYNRVMRLLNNSDSFDIETPSSTASVRGTAFQITVLDAEATFYAADEGLVNIALGDEQVDLPGGYQLLARAGEPLNVVQQGPPVLILTSPAESPARGSTVEVSGQTLPGTRVTVGGIPVIVAADGTFSTQVQAIDAAIQVEATDLNGLTLSIVITTH